MMRRVLPFVLIALTAGPASAERLFVPDGARGRTVATTRVDAPTARDLASRRRAFVLTDVPLAGGGSASFTLAPIEVFTPDATLVEFDGAHARAIGRPDVAVYEGTDVATPSRTMVLTIVDGTQVGAFVRDGQRIVSRIEPAGDGQTHAVIDPVDVPADPSRSLCDNHLSPEGGMAPNGVRRAVASAASPPAPGSPSPTLAAEVLVDVANDLYTGPFGSSSPFASQYVAGLFGAVSGVYRRDVGVAMLIKQLVIWTTPDPFAGADTLAQLTAYQSWNQANRVGVPRDTAHLLANLSGAGGRAYLDTLCDGNGGYGVSNLHGDVGTFHTIGSQWDVQVVAHELGHNFGSPHTHCYVPPLDHCYNTEPGCYAGPVEPQVGEIMSYCHLVDSVDLALGFSPTVEAVMRTGAENGACIGPAPGTCGNGVVENGETCDDGNTVDGDCCAANCVAEPGLACADDGDPCTTDACSEAGLCAHTPPGSCTPCQAATVIPPAGGTFTGTTVGASTVSSACGGAGPERAYSWTPASDGLASIDTCAGGPELTCNNDAPCGLTGRGSRLNFLVSAGTTYYVFVDGFAGAAGDYGLSVGMTPIPICNATPLSGCKQSLGSGKAQLQLKDASDDAKDRLQWKWGRGDVTTMADLGNPDASDFYQLCIYDTGGLKSDAVVTPGGTCTGGKPCWTARPTGFFYTDKSAAPDGIEKLMLRSSAVAGKAQIKLKGTGTLLHMPSLLGLTPPLRVQLVRPGGPCWEATYSAPTVKSDGSQLKAKSD